MFCNIFNCEKTLLQTYMECACFISNLFILVLEAPQLCMSSRTLLALALLKVVMTRRQIRRLNRSRCSTREIDQSHFAILIFRYEKLFAPAPLTGADVQWHKLNKRRRCLLLSSQTSLWFAWCLALTKMLKQRHVYETCSRNTYVFKNKWHVNS